LEDARPSLLVGDRAGELVARVRKTLYVRLKPRYRNK
jgi:hypothetical protein